VVNKRSPHVVGSFVESWFPVNDRISAGLSRQLGEKLMIPSSQAGTTINGFVCVMLRGSGEIQGVFPRAQPRSNAAYASLVFASPIVGFARRLLCKGNGHFATDRDLGSWLVEEQLRCPANHTFHSFPASLDRNFVQNQPQDVVERLGIPRDRSFVFRHDPSDDNGKRCLPPLTFFKGQLPICLKQKPHCVHALARAGVKKDRACRNHTRESVVSLPQISNQRSPIEHIAQGAPSLDQLANKAVGKHCAFLVVIRAALRILEEYPWEESPRYALLTCPKMPKNLSCSEVSHVLIEERARQVFAD
jgi:hypothetical protein